MGNFQLIPEYSFLAISLLCVLIPTIVSAGNGVSYDNVLSWGGKCSSFLQQSPINFNSTDGSLESNYSMLLWNTAQSDTPILDVSSWIDNLMVSTDMIIPVSRTKSGTLKPGGFSINVSPSQNYHVRFVDGAKNRGTSDYVTFDTTELHFHTPGEHRLDGRAFPMDLHIINVRNDSVKGSKNLVIGLFFDISDSNESDSPLVETLISSYDEAISGLAVNSSLSEIRIPVSVNISRFINEEAGGLVGELTAYQGSRTTPPCAEQVQWVHFHQTVLISLRQWNRMREILGYNARPTVPRFSNGKNPYRRNWLSRFKSSSYASDPLFWSYGGDRGPYVWNSVYKDCQFKAGNSQSPIDLAANSDNLLVSTLPTDKPITESLISYRWGILHNQPVTISPTQGIYANITIDTERLSSGQSVEEFIKLKKGTGFETNSANEQPSMVILKRNEFLLRGIKVSTVSEHRINGSFFPMELQLLHSATDSNETSVIISFMFDIQPSSDATSVGFIGAIAELIRNPSTDENGLKVIDIDLRALDKHLQSISPDKVYTYQGSLTMPPCTPGITWYIVTEPMQLSLRDWKALSYTVSSRPLISG